MTVNETGCGFDSQSRKFNIYLNDLILYIIFFALVSRQSAGLSSAIQLAIPPPNFAMESGAIPPPNSGVESGEQSVLTLTVLCLSVCEIQRETDFFLYL